MTTRLPEICGALAGVGAVAWVALFVRAARAQRRAARTPPPFTRRCISRYCGRPVPADQDYCASHAEWAAPP